MKKLNWRYAIGEFLIVVAGIFVAFELQNFTKIKQRQKDALSYHERLLADVELDIENYEVRRNNSERNVATILSSLEALKAKRLPDSLVTNFDYMINSYYRFDDVTLNATTYNEMVSSGKLDLIKNIELRSALGKYVTQMAGVTSLWEVFTEGVEEVTFYFDQYVYSNVTISSSYTTSEYDFKAMANDQHLINSLSRIAMKWSVVFHQSKNSIEIAQALKEQLKQELE